MKAQRGSRGTALLPLTLALDGVQIKNKMGRACGTYGTGEGLTVFWCGDLREKHHLEHLGVKGMIILKLVFNKCDGGAWTGLIWLRIGTVGGLCDRSNEPSGYLKCGEFLDQLLAVSFSRRTLLH